MRGHQYLHKMEEGVWSFSCCQTNKITVAERHDTWIWTTTNMWTDWNIHRKTLEVKNNPLNWTCTIHNYSHMISGSQKQRRNHQARWRGSHQMPFVDDLIGLAGKIIPPRNYPVHNHKLVSVKLHLAKSFQPVMTMVHRVPKLTLI